MGNLDGGSPDGTLISDGTFLYGMTDDGGANLGAGAIFKVSMVIGIEEYSERSRINIYPNPAHTTFTISLDGLNIENGKLNIYDVTGREVYSDILRNTKYEIQSTFSAGVYLVKVQAGDRVVTEKVVVE